MSGLVVWLIIGIGNRWLAKLTLKRTTKLLSICFLGLLSVILTTFIGIIIQVVATIQYFNMDGESVPTDVLAETIVVGSIVGMILGSLVFFLITAKQLKRMFL